MGLRQIDFVHLTPDWGCWHGGLQAAKGIMAGMYIAEFAHKRSNGSSLRSGRQSGKMVMMAGLPACLQQSTNWVKNTKQGVDQ